MRKVLRDPHVQGIEESTEDALCREINTLIRKSRSSPRHRYFGLSDNTTDLDQIDFGKAAATVQETAPSWWRIMSRVLQTKRADWASHKSSVRSLGGIKKRLCMITSMVCHSRQSKSSNFLIAAINGYLTRAGTRRTVVKKLGELGVCHGYSTARCMVKKFTNAAKDDDMQATQPTDSAPGSPLQTPTDVAPGSSLQVPTESSAI